MHKTILVVDDEPITLRGLKKTLESWSNRHFEILTASNAQQAIELINNQKVHLLITDICMPEMSGLNMLKALKEKNEFPVAIIISAHSDFNFAQEAIEIGVVNYLLKPVNKQKLISEVEKALNVEEKRQRASINEKVVDEQLAGLNTMKHSEGPIKKAIEYVVANLDKQLTLKGVANYVHLNPSYFSVLFKEQTNITFSEFLTRSRLQKAKNLLLTSNLSVTQISELVGYSTPKYFIKIFKEYEGVTPSKYK